jgi:hypothetical protein
MWLLKILTDKNLKEREKKFRLELIKSNLKLIKDLNYINQQSKFLIKQQEKDFDEMEIQLFKSINFRQLIETIELINYSTNVLFVSNERVEKMNRYSKKLRSFIDDVWMPLLVSRLDSFSNLRSEISKKMILKLSIEKFERK